MEVTGNHHGLAIQERFGFDRYTSKDLLREADLALSGRRSKPRCLNVWQAVLPPLKLRDRHGRSSP
jgi:hypothetical protein